MDVGCAAAHGEVANRTSAMLNTTVRTAVLIRIVLMVIAIWIHKLGNHGRIIDVATALRLRARHHVWGQGQVLSQTLQ